MKLGDMVEVFARDFLGVKKPCEPCKRRKEKLNAFHDRVTGQRRKGPAQPR